MSQTKNMTARTPEMLGKSCAKPTPNGPCIRPYWHPGKCHRPDQHERQADALTARVAELERHLVACCQAIEQEVSASSSADDEDLNATVVAHANVAAVARAALKGKA